MKTYPLSMPDVIPPSLRRHFALQFKVEENHPYISPATKGKFYYEVYVWRTQETMQKVLEQKGCGGLCRSYKRLRIEKDGAETELLQLGEIHLALDTVTAETVAHECGHGALEWARRKQVDPIKENPRDSSTSVVEEAFCYVLGGFVAAITDKLRSAK